MINKKKKLDFVDDRELARYIGFLEGSNELLHNFTRSLWREITNIQERRKKEEKRCGKQIKE